MLFQIPQALIKPNHCLLWLIEAFPPDQFMLQLCIFTVHAFHTHRENNIWISSGFEISVRDHCESTDVLHSPWVDPAILNGNTVDYFTLILSITLDSYFSFRISTHFNNFIGQNHGISVGRLRLFLHLK